MLNQDKTEIRKARHHMTQEDFTPPGIVEQMCSYFSEDLYKDFSKTVCDPCCGIGNILCFVIEKRFNAYSVTAGKKRIFLFIINRICKNSV